MDRQSTAKVVSTCANCSAHHTRNDWHRLERLGTMQDGRLDHPGWLELRNCQCGNTLAIQVRPLSRAKPYSQRWDPVHSIVTWVHLTIFAAACLAAGVWLYVCTP